MKPLEYSTYRKNQTAAPGLLLVGSLSAVAVLAIFACLPGLCAEGEGKSSVAVGISGGGTSVTGTSDTSASTAGAGTLKLEGNAQVTELETGAAQRASQDYRKGLAALSGNNFAQAATLFKRAGEQFGHGFEKYKAEAHYAEAQCRRQIGQMDESGSLYQAAIDLFRQYDPKNPFLKASVEQRNSAFKAMTPALDSRRVIKGATSVEQTITLKGNVNDDGTRMAGEKAILDVDKKFIKDSVHQCFVEMTCLETAEIGSNSTNAKNRWVPLMAYGKTAAMTATDDFFSPVIKVKINGKMQNINVVLPGLSSSQRTVLLVTDSEKIAAIDPGTNDVWLLEMKFRQNGKGDFTWKKLLHQKSKIKHELRRP